MSTAAVLPNAAGVKVNPIKSTTTTATITVAKPNVAIELPNTGYTTPQKNKTIKWFDLFRRMLTGEVVLCYGVPQKQSQGGVFVPSAFKEVSNGQCFEFVIEGPVGEFPFGLSGVEDPKKAGIVDWNLTHNVDFDPRQLSGELTGKSELEILDDFLERKKQNGGTHKALPWETAQHARWIAYYESQHRDAIAKYGNIWFAYVNSHVSPKFPEKRLYNFGPVAVDLSDPNEVRKCFNQRRKQNTTVKESGEVYPDTIPAKVVRYVDKKTGEAKWFPKLHIKTESGAADVSSVAVPELDTRKPKDPNPNKPAKIKWVVKQFPAHSRGVFSYTTGTLWFQQTGISCTLNVNEILRTRLPTQFQHGCSMENVEDVENGGSEPKVGAPVDAANKDDVNEEEEGEHFDDSPLPAAKKQRTE